MRFQFKLVPVEGRARLDFNYQYKLAGVVYKLLELGNESLAVKYHASTDFKFFTFSWLFGNRKVSEDGIVFDGPVKWYVSSPVEEFMEAILEGAFTKPELKIGKSNFVLSEVKVLEEPDFTESGTHVFRTLSPILVRGFKEKKKNPHWDLSPKESKFYVNLRDNLVKKHKQLYGKEPTDTRFNIMEVSNPEQKRILIKNEYYRCYMMRITVEGSPELLKLAYQAGIGEKNSMGFGMVVDEGWNHV